MKKIMLVLGFVLGLSLVGSLKAQLTVRNGYLKFTAADKIISFVRTKPQPAEEFNESSVVAALEINPSIDLGVSMLCDQNDMLTLGSSDKKLRAIYVNSLDYKTSKSLSDFRYKANIVDLAPALDKIMQLRPVRFDYRKEKEGVIDSMYMNRMGLIAQELEAVVPEVVHYSEYDDIYSVDYVSLIPLLIKTAQEQQALIEDLQAQVEELQTLVLSSDVTTASARHQNSRETSTTVGASTQDAPAAAAPAATINENKLWSNTPNPFKQETHIRYALTNNVQNAQLCIYNLTGEQIACHRLSDRGQNNFTLRAGSLRPGIYLYSLIADGQVVDTHRMVVTE